MHNSFGIRSGKRREGENGINGRTEEEERGECEKESKKGIAAKEVTLRKMEKDQQARNKEEKKETKRIRRKRKVD
jgi:hypothetical protein